MSETEELVDVVRVSIGGRRFGLPAASAREVFPMLEAAPVPGWPRQALGLLNIRGERLPLLDAAWVLDRAERTPSMSDLIVILDAADRRWALRVDAVHDVVEAAIRPPLPADPFLALSRLSLCKGVVTESDATLAVIDPERLLRYAGLLELDLPDEIRAQLEQTP